MASIAIVGAGLVGRLAALLLCRQHQVSLFEKSTLDAPNATGRVAAAMLAPVSESVDACEHIVAMGKASLQLWPDLLATLNIALPVEVNGTLVVAHRQDLGDMQSFARRVQAAKASCDEVRHLNRSQLDALEPELPKAFNTGLFIPNEGHINNRQLFDLSREALLGCAVNVYENTEVSVCGSALAFNGDKQPFNWIIDCRGVGAKHQWQGSGAALRGVRGEVIRVRAPEVNFTRQIRLMHPRYPLYLVPKGNHEYVMGATQIESQSTKAVTVRSALELLSAAYSLHSGFAEAEILSMRASLRPAFTHNQPHIAVANGVIQINGLYRHGYLIAPVVLATLLEQLKMRGVATPSFYAAQLAQVRHAENKLVVNVSD
jgi:glycine oxidase